MTCGYGYSSLTHSFLPTLTTKTRQDVCFVCSTRPTRPEPAFAAPHMVKDPTQLAKKANERGCTAAAVYTALCALTFSVAASGVCRCCRRCRRCCRCFLRQASNEVVGVCLPLSPRGVHPHGVVGFFVVAVDLRWMRHRGKKSSCVNAANRPSLRTMRDSIVILLSLQTLFATNFLRVRGGKHVAFLVFRGRQILGVRNTKHIPPYRVFLGSGGFADERLARTRFVNENRSPLSMGCTAKHCACNSHTSRLGGSQSDEIGDISKSRYTRRRETKNGQGGKNKQACTRKTTLEARISAMTAYLPPFFARNSDNALL